MPKKITMYTCSFCNTQKPAFKERMITHESNCFFNPKNRACASCKHLKRRLRINEERDNFKGYIYECKKLDKRFVKLEASHNTFFTLQRWEVQKLSTFEVIQEGNIAEWPFPEFPRRDCKSWKRKKL